MVGHDKTLGSMCPQIPLKHHFPPSRLRSSLIHLAKSNQFTTTFSRKPPGEGSTENNALCPLPVLPPPRSAGSTSLGLSSTGSQVPTTPELMHTEAGCEHLRAQHTAQ